jgi:hypothetical protein
MDKSASRLSEIYSMKSNRKLIQIGRGKTFTALASSQQQQQRE